MSGQIVAQPGTVRTNPVNFAFQVRFRPAELTRFADKCPCVMHLWLDNQVPSVLPSSHSFIRPRRLRPHGPLHLMALHTSWPHDQLGEHLAGTEPFMLRRFEAGGGARAAGFLAARAAYSLLLLSGGGRSVSASGFSFLSPSSLSCGSSPSFCSFPHGSFSSSDSSSPTHGPHELGR